MTQDIRRTEGPQELRLDLPAAHSAGRMARQMLRPFALRVGVPESEVDTLEFVAGELLDNAVDHGGGGAAMETTDLNGDVRMTLHLEVVEKAWIVRVGDQGGANPDEMRNLIAPKDGLPDLEDERGRGFFLLSQMVDKILVSRSEDGLGLVFEVSKKYDAAT
jgi:anti-sigma regulatory factor (Ser/Thr protein kinase)